MTANECMECGKPVANYQHICEKCFKDEQKRVAEEHETEFEDSIYKDAQYEAAEKRALEDKEEPTGFSLENEGQLVRNSLPRIAPSLDLQAMKRYIKMQDEDLVSKTEIISASKHKDQRWVAVVYNGIPHTVVLTRNLKSGRCTCKDFKFRRRTCKHMMAVAIAIKRAKKGLAPSHFYPWPRSILRYVLRLFFYWH